MSSRACHAFPTPVPRIPSNPGLQRSQGAALPVPLAACSSFSLLIFTPETGKLASLLRGFGLVINSVRLGGLGQAGMGVTAAQHGKGRGQGLRVGLWTVLTRA